MSATKRSDKGRWLRRWGFVLACVSAIGTPAFSSEAAAQSSQYRTFPSPEDAVKTLVETVKKGDVDSLLAIFGPGSKDLIFSGDETQDKASFQHFATAFQTMNRWRKQADGSDAEEDEG